VFLFSFFDGDSDDDASGEVIVVVDVVTGRVEAIDVGCGEILFLIVVDGRDDCDGCR
jgi:hypothetical protein